MLDTDGGDRRLGLRFGMTGTLLVDGRAGVDRLIYSRERDEPAWDRFTVRFADGGRLVVRDPRLLGGVELDPDESVLGPDALRVTAGGAAPGARAQRRWRSRRGSWTSTAWPAWAI